MAWDFSTESEYATQLQWVEEFVREECEPLDLVIKESKDLTDPVRQRSSRQGDPTDLTGRTASDPSEPEKHPGPVEQVRQDRPYGLDFGVRLG
jgi:hypothetical protein